MRHVEHVEIIVWYLVDTSLNFPNPLPPPKIIVQDHPPVLPNDAYRQKTDQTDTHFDFIFMMVLCNMISKNLFLRYNTIIILII